METQLNSSFESTPTWIVALICFLIVFVSLCAERGLHRLGKFLKRGKQDALFEALQKLKEELMLLGFISLLLTAFQGLISRICMPAHLAYHMLPCKRHSAKANAHILPINNKRLLLSVKSESGYCPREGQIPLLSLETLHQLHIFIFVLALVHVIFCVTTMVLGGARIRQWKWWEDSIRREISQVDTCNSGKDSKTQAHHHLEFVEEYTRGYWRKAAVISWMIAFFKQFFGSITKADYIALRHGFIKKHVPGNPMFDFHKYMTRTLEVDFKKIVGISWYLWFFVVLFLLLNLEGWHAYFWLSFLPLILLLLVGAKLEHIITRLAQEQVRQLGDQEAEGGGRAPVKPSDEHFWFGRPALVLYLIHFILFQNSFEIAFFFWIWSTYGFKSCIMEKIGFIVTRLIIGVIVQVLCSYSTLPLYAIVTQMGTMFKKGMFDEMVESSLVHWVEKNRMKKEVDLTGNAKGKASQGTSEIVQALKIGDARLKERQQE